MSASILNYLRPLHVVMYVEGMENKVMDGQRLSVVRWKTPQDKMKDKTYVKPSNVAVPLPKVVLSVTPDCLQSAMIEAIEALQDAAVRKFITDKMIEVPGINLASIVIPEEIGTAEGLASFSQSQASSGRLSKEGLSNWFDAVIADALVDLVIGKNPALTAEQAVGQVEKAKTVLCSLASPRTAMPVSVATQLLKAVQVAPASDKVRMQLETKLDGYINPPSTEELLLSL